MGSKMKKTQLGRKEQYERELKNRLFLLAEKKIETPRIDKDPLVKSLRAQIEATDARLKAIARIEQRTAELAKIKAEKTDAEKMAKAAATGIAAEGGKEKAKEPKKVPAAAKEKKKKKE